MNHSSSSSPYRASVEAKAVPRTPVSVFSAFTATALDALAEKIIDSGQLGRSPTYTALLRYLVQCAHENRTPKEVEIALDVLGRTADFDVSKDSVVRVYIHQLRKRLDAYYQYTEQDCDYHLVIPRGQYTLAALPVPGNTEPGSLTPAADPLMPDRQHSTRNWLILLGVLLLLNVAWTIGNLLDQSVASPSLEAASHKMWAAMMDDELPILLVMGDYYIFGEQDDNGRINRMVRDFSINSADELEQQQRENPETAANYLDLDLNYLPEGSAFALSRIMPILQATGKRVNVTMMSRLNTADLKTNHIVYIGYISALNKLRPLVFASSGLQIGRTYDELYNRGSGEIYSSDAGLPQQGEAFRDYGLLSAFPAPGGIQFVIIAGTRDAGLMHSAQAAAQSGQLQQIENSLELSYTPAFASHEALFEVFGFDRLNFDANLVHTRVLDSSLIWGGGLSLQ
ncbi:MAG: hypothetical protein RQ757_12630 [Pseudomonadales bacterium]|nr:hypothetical protein [Pseudomonadales bacterium]